MGNRFLCRTAIDRDVRVILLWTLDTLVTIRIEFLLNVDLEEAFCCRRFARPILKESQVEGSRVKNCDFSIPAETRWQIGRR